MTAFKPLREIITFKGGGTPSKQIPGYWNGAIPWATVKDFVSTSLDRTQDSITEAGLRNSSANLIFKGHVVIPTRMSLGKAAINTIDIAINQDLRALIPKIPLDAHYLLHAILSLKDEIIKKGSGATVKGITQEALYNLKVFVPPLDDQKRIAHLLGKVEGLIARRKQHLQQLDDLLKSVFLDMFGFRDQTFAQWKMDKLASHTEVVSGVTKGKKYKTEDLIEVPYMRVANVQDGHLSLSEIKTIAVSQKEIDQYQLRAGDLLLTEGGDPDKLGRGSVWEEQITNCIHQNHIFRVRISEREELNPYYLSALIGSRYGKSYFLKSAKQTTGIASINSTQLKKFPTVIPPIDLQNLFAVIAEKVEGLKSRYQQSLAGLGTLYGALSQKAFKGELDLSRVLLPAEAITEGTETHRKPKPLTQGFARQLLAAEILHRHNNRGMTQMKLQKLIHLVEYHARLDEIQGDYQRQAAGPFDNKMMYGIASGLKKQQWFEMRGCGQNATYSPLLKVGAHEKYLPCWQDKISKIDEVLHLLGTARPDQCEIVSTLYAAWNDLLIDGEEITDERIIEQASKAELWHKTKEAIDPGRWPKALRWMRDHHLVPTSYGKHTRKLP